MWARILFGLSALILGLLLRANPVRAQVLVCDGTFHNGTACDGTFNDLDWTASFAVNTSGATFAVAQQAIGGNPGA